MRQDAKSADQVASDNRPKPFSEDGLWDAADGRFDAGPDDEPGEPDEPGDGPLISDMMAASCLWLAFYLNGFFNKKL